MKLMFTYEMVTADAVITSIRQPLPAGECIRDENSAGTRLNFRRALRILGSAVNAY